MGIQEHAPLEKFAIFEIKLLHLEDLGNQMCLRYANIQCNTRIHII